MFNRLFMSWEGTSWAMSKELCNFLAGGLGSNLYWAMALRESSSESSGGLSFMSLQLSTTSKTES